MNNYQVALITGAASGLGRALSLALAREGTAIAAVDLNEDGLRSLAEELGRLNRRCAWAVADVTDAAALKRGAEELEKSLGPVELLIASAGVGIETSALNLDAAVMAKVIGVNLVGVSNSIAVVLPGMLARKKGHVVAISSVASFRGLPRMLGYCASKAGVNALMEGLRLEVGRHGISATTICPGWIKTPMTEQVKVPMPHILEVEEAARRILGAVQRRDRFFAFPRPVVWRLRFLSWLPAWLQDRLIEKMVKDA